MHQIINLALNQCIARKRYYKEGSDQGCVQEILSKGGDQELQTTDSEIPFQIQAGTFIKQRDTMVSLSRLGGVVLAVIVRAHQRKA